MLVKACRGSKKTYNSGTNNVFFVVLQFLVICGSCHMTRDYCSRNLTLGAIIHGITVASGLITSFSDGTQATTVYFYLCYLPPHANTINVPLTYKLKTQYRSQYAFLHKG